MVSEYTFEGWMGLDGNAIGNMVWQSYEPKPFAETDVDIKITHCGVGTPFSEPRECKRNR